ncbi:MAG: sigma-54-dependent Fis family transcriptional regulator [Fibrobacteres bacterium]|nr:sigma-54-dependent Fis family transcriptional regulator [Fibrobacterota bacterium]
MVGLHGYNAPNSLTPDQAGYSIGYSADNKTIQFKKKGYLICSWLINDEISENEGKHLSVTLGENFFIYKMNGKIIAEHYNFSPLSSFQKYLNLAIATKETVSVSNMVLQKTDDFKASTNLNNYNTLRLLCKPDRHYAAAYVANPYLKKSSRHIRGLMLHEVTDLAHKIENEHLANIKLRNALDSVSASTEFLVSRNERMKKVISEAEIASKSDFAIFIEGATGTGKELLARAIHENSRRNSRPFVKMDCAAIPMQLFETIVFGHIKGAFTGAVSDNSGILALSTGGTVFIDGIENVPLIQQSKLLGALENSFITPLGATQSSKIDVRYIVSSSSSSADLIKNSVLRRDLFHRVSTFYLKIPPLKERKEDLPALCQIFIEQYNVEFSKRIKTLTQNHIDIMENYDWPGNIRELRNLVFRLSAFAENEEIKVNSLKEAMLHHNNLSATSDKAHNYCGRITREQLLAVLNECGNNVSRCARRLKVERSTIYYNLKKFAIHLATIVLSI